MNIDTFILSALGGNFRQKFADPGTDDEHLLKIYGGAGDAAPALSATYTFLPEHHAEISLLRVTEKGRGIGGAFLRGFARAADAHKIPEVDISNVGEQGFSFWPRMGGVPVASEGVINTALKKVSAAPRGTFPDTDLATIKAAHVSLENGYPITDIWRSLSRKPAQGGLGNACLGTLVHHAVDKGSMIINLEDAETRARIGLAHNSTLRL